LSTVKKQKNYNIDLRKTYFWTTQTKNELSIVNSAYTHKPTSATIEQQWLFKEHLKTHLSNSLV